MYKLLNVTKLALLCHHHRTFKPHSKSPELFHRLQQKVRLHNTAYRLQEFVSKTSDSDFYIYIQIANMMLWISHIVQMKNLIAISRCGVWSRCGVGHWGRSQTLSSGSYNWMTEAYLFCIVGRYFRNFCFLFGGSVVEPPTFFGFGQKF